jgi:nicotinamidase-related amidase
MRYWFTLHNLDMPQLHCPVEDALVVVVDVQPAFMAAIHESDRVLKRTRFLMQAAALLGVPFIATEQNPSRMGSLDPTILPLMSTAPISKMAFSCCGGTGFQDAVDFHERSSVILVGIETHICVTLTALDLANNGYKVFVCPDAVSSRTNEMHKLGMERMRDSGIVPSHTESLVYEWMGTADHPKFKEVLELVKNA